MESQSYRLPGRKAEAWIALALCIAVLLSRVVEHRLPHQPSHGPSLAPDWLPLAAVVFAAAQMVRLNGWPQWLRLQRALGWCSLLLMVWIANGLPFDLLTMAGLIGDATGHRAAVNWPGFATRALALAAAVVLARRALANPPGNASRRAPVWYAYAAFAFAMPYPILRLHWAFGGTLGLDAPGDAGKGFSPLLITIPFVLAAALSLLLASPRRWVPRRLLLAAGWTATAIMSMIGPAGCWVVFTTFVYGSHTDTHGIAPWVFFLFYGSWFFLAIAEGAATRSYQLRTAALPSTAPVATPE